MTSRTVLGLTLLTCANAVLDWISLPCPSAVASNSCAYQNPSSSQDMAVSLFFQVEDTQSIASFQCASGDVVHCARSWSLSEQGSAGTCFFILKASQEFQCSGYGTVNVIGAHAVKLTGKLLGSDEKQVPCTGVLDSCSYENSGSHDQWVTMSFTTSSTDEGLSCQTNAGEVCGFASKGNADESSCAFLLPSGDSLSCKATAGSPSITSLVAVPLVNQLTPTGERLKSTCPPETGHNTTLCDCTYKNPTNHDLIVSMNAMNADGKFNSFHCAVGSANTCAWGANNGESGAAGQCYFILPAGGEYGCWMQFGATAFPSVTILPLSGKSIFPASSVATHQEKRKTLGVSHIPATRSTIELQRLFDEFQSKHGPVDQARFKYFAQFVALTDTHPSNPVLRHGGELSPLATLSQDEFEATYRNCAKVEAGTMPEFGLTDADMRTPTTVDWRTKGAVTPVKDQGQCGSCWTFSTTGVLEGAWSIAGHGLTSLSEQHLVSCDNKDGNEGCNGGWPYRAIDFVHKQGIDTELSYPYASGQGSVPACAASSGRMADIRVLKHTVVESDEAVMAAWVAKNGPVSVSVDAMTQLWWPYRGGILDGCCNHDVDHAVLIVGFGDSNGRKYWLIKNSWNENWGEQGYMRLGRGTNQCGITYQPVGAVVGSAPPSPPSPPSPPTPPTPPTPPAPPTPSSDCPSDAEVVSTARGKECKWVNGTGGLVMPPRPSEYCDYIAQGYFGYLWDKAQGSYNCPTSAHNSASSDSYFCVWSDGDVGVKIPKGSVADCGRVAQGQIGFVLPSDGTLVV